MNPKTSAASGPDTDDVARGAHFCSVIDSWASRDPGTICDRSGAMAWSYAVDSDWPHIFPLTLFLKADFIVSSPSGEEILRIRRRGIPPSFSMIQNGRVVGKITYRNIIRTRSTLAFAAGPTWTFRQRLFTLCFYGDSDAGQRLWMVVGPSKRQWNMLLPPGTEDVCLPAALAFLHREYWRH